MARIFLISPVRNTTLEIDEDVKTYVKYLEDTGHTVFWPKRDNKEQSKDENGFLICSVNKIAMLSCDRIYLWHSEKSEFSLFDMGMVFMAGKRFHIANPRALPVTEGKSKNNFFRKLAEISGQQFLD